MPGNAEGEASQQVVDDRSTTVSVHACQCKNGMDVHAGMDDDARCDNEKVATSFPCHVVDFRCSVRSHDV